MISQHTQFERTLDTTEQKWNISFPSYVLDLLSRQYSKLRVNKLRVNYLDDYGVSYHKRFTQYPLNNTYKLVLILKRASLTIKSSIFLRHDWFISNYKSHWLLWHFWLQCCPSSYISQFPQCWNHRWMPMPRVLVFVDTDLRLRFLQSTDSHFLFLLSASYGPSF